MSDFPLSEKNSFRLSKSGVYTTTGRPIAYSEGSETENYLRMVLQRSKDVSSHSLELEKWIKDWPSEYHLSSLRANILRGLNLQGIANILELGCGCGSITRYLGELGAEVEGVEGGEVRAELAAIRCRDLDNVKIVRADFNELTFPSNCYDAIIMIGVIEYAAMFNSDSDDDREAVRVIFEKAKASLKPEGVLILALENRVGLKYLYGACEDHCAEKHVGIYDYPNRNGVRTYSRQEWQDILLANKWQHFSFLLPFPDYKLPRVVLAEDFVKHDAYAHSLLYRIESRDYTSPWASEADEYLSWRGIHKANLLPEMANSFLIVASQEKTRIDQVVDKDFIHFSSMSRQPAYRTMTLKYVDDLEVKKEKVFKDTTKCGLVEQSVGVSAYYSGELLATHWILTIRGNDPLREFPLQLQKYFVYLKAQIGDELHSPYLLELLPSNIIVDEKSGEWKTFDLEWRSSERIIAEYVFFRAVFWFSIHNKKLLKGFPGQTFTSVEDFVSYCFTQVHLEFPLFLTSCIDIEESFHSGVVADEQQKIDVSYMLAMDLGADKEGHSQTIKEGIDKKKKERYINLVRLLKRAFKVIQSYLFEREYRILFHSRLFDSGFYRQKDSELQNIGIDPLLHYVQTGYKEEGRDPSPCFSSSYYFAQFPHLREGQQNPLFHYVEVGCKKNGKPHYLLKNYLLKPGMLWRDPELLKKNQQSGEVRTFFDPKFYCSMYPDVDRSEMEPVVHYLRHGCLERRQPGPFFDPQWYIDRTPLFEQFSEDLLKHFVEIGAKLGKSPIPVFDVGYYKKKYLGPDCKNDDVFEFYLEKGLDRDDAPCSWFDPEYYRLNSPDLSPFEFPLGHYLYKGVYQGIYVNECIAKLPKKPLISVIVPVYNVKEAYLNCCIRSVLFQSYPHWELCIVDDGSDYSTIQDQLAGWQRKEERVKVKYLPANGGIARASNEAAQMALGEYMIFLDNDDELHPEALYHMVKNLCETGADVLYSDETLIGDDGSELSHFHKPGFNQELLYSHNYINHLVLIKRESFHSAGGFASVLSGAQDHDLLLKVSENTSNIGHIPEVLYRWRASEKSTSINHNQKEYADKAGMLALTSMLERRGVKGEVLPGLWKYYHRIKREVRGAPSVSVLLRSFESDYFINWLDNLISSCTYANVEFVINGDKALKDKIFSYFRRNERIIFLETELNNNPAKLYNNAVAAASGEHIVLLDSLIEPESSYWLESLLEYSQEGWCGVIEGMISPHENQGNLTIPDFSQVSAAYYSQFIKMCSRHMNGLHCAQEISMASCDFTMIQREKFLAVGGFDESFQSTFFFDCDLSLRLMHQGYSNAYTPYARSISGLKANTEKSLRGSEEDKKLFQSKWHNYLVSGDKYYNTRLIAQSGLDMENFYEWYAGITQSN